jgi:hypothetical protein
MNPSPIISYELAQSRITDLRHQARRESLAHAALARTTQPVQPRKPQPRKLRVPSRLRLRLRGA